MPLDAQLPKQQKQPVAPKRAAPVPGKAAAKNSSAAPVAVPSGDDTIIFEQETGGDAKGNPIRKT